MKKFLPLLVLLVFVGYAASKARAPKNPGAFDVIGFGKLPVLMNGRLKPLDTVARSSLLQIQGRQRVALPNGEKRLPIEWLLDVAFRPEIAESYQVFEIANPDVLAAANLKREDGRNSNGDVGRPDGRWFSYKQLTSSFAELDRQSKLAGQTDAGARTPFQRAVLQLYGNLVHYQRLRHAFVSPERTDFLGDLLKLQDNVSTWRTALGAKMNNQPHDEAAAAAALEVADPIFTMANVNNLLLLVPPDDAKANPDGWRAVGPALIETFQTGRVNSAALAYAGFAHAWRNNQPEKFNKLTELFRAELTKQFAARLKKSDVETRFNATEPFYHATIIFAVAALAGVLSWLTLTEPLRRSALGLLSLAWVLTTVGIITRMWIEGRPPITNLYSTAPFIGWAAVALCIVIEGFFKNAIGSVAGGVLGVATLIIAHHLSLSGDTLEMMRAVLDSNFWLATHVVVINLGYAATALAGFLALIYIFRGVFTTTLDKATADALARMVYGVVCFATLASFVGTILGGIWADQSWGRFWGWDPKENGALIIVIWNAIILHARWGGMVKHRGLMCLAIGGNIATAWSWFGVNMLGVGLHSYGFTDAAFIPLVSFGVSQLVIIGIANLPLEKWRSFRNRTAIPNALEHEENLTAAGR